MCIQVLQSRWNIDITFLSHSWIQSLGSCSFSGFHPILQWSHVHSLTISEHVAYIFVINPFLSWPVNGSTHPAWNENTMFIELYSLSGITPCSPGVLNNQFNCIHASSWESLHEVQLSDMWFFNCWKLWQDLLGGPFHAQKRFPLSTYCTETV